MRQKCVHFLHFGAVVVVPAVGMNNGGVAEDELDMRDLLLEVQQLRQSLNGLVIRMREQSERDDPVVDGRLIDVFLYYQIPHYVHRGVAVQIRQCREDVIPGGQKEDQQLQR